MRNVEQFLRSKMRAAYTALEIADATKEYTSEVASFCRKHATIGRTTKDGKVTFFYWMGQ